MKFIANHSLCSLDVDRIREMGRRVRETLRVGFGVWERYQREIMHVYREDDVDDDIGDDSRHTPSSQKQRARVNQTAYVSHEIRSVWRVGYVRLLITSSRERNTNSNGSSSRHDRRKIIMSLFELICYLEGSKTICLCSCAQHTQQQQKTVPM